MAPRVQSLIGVYDADGGLRGEAAYVLGRIVGTAHCSLCDITHSPIRRKPAWDEMVARLNVPFSLLHRDEQPTDVAAVTGGIQPMVVARIEGAADPVVLVGPAPLAACEGRVDAFEELLRGEVDGLGLVLPEAPQVNCSTC